MNTDSNPNNEGVGELKDYFTVANTDSELVKMINGQIEGALGTHNDFKKDGKKNEYYWAADHLRSISLRWHNSRIVQNVIYTGVETMIPIITSRPAEPIISIADDEQEDEEESKEFVDMLEKVLLDKYYDEDYPQQELMEMLARHLLLYKVGIPKIIWDERIDDYIIEYIHPHKMIVSADGHYNQDVWGTQYLEKPLKWILEQFPEKTNEIIANMFPGKTEEDIKQFGNTVIGFWEYHPEDGSYVVWKMKDVILQKKLNPYLVWTDDKEFDKTANHFDYPHKPVMFLNSQNLGRHIWDDTTPVMQALSVQDGINLMQRIITDTARDQGILIGAQELIDRDELYKYTGAPTDKLSVKGADPARALHRLEPKQLAQFVQENLVHLIGMADNIMGTHATTRGDRSGNTTLGQDQLAKESDYGRIDLIVRGIERLSIEIYNWEVQMMLAKYTAKHYAKVLGEEKGKRLFELMKKFNKRGIKIVVKAGSTLPTDKISMRAEALDLAKMNRISNLDLYKRLDFPNPMEMAKNVYLEANAPQELYKDLQPLMEQQAAAQAQQQQQLPAAGAVPGQEQALAGGQPLLPDQGAIPQAGAQPVAGQQMQPVPQLPSAESVPEGQAPAVQVPGVAQSQLPPDGSPIIPEGGQTQGVPEMAGGQQLPGATEHTAAILQGQEVPPFEGIDPTAWVDHSNAEFAFIADDGYLNLSPEIQALYAQHALAERKILQEQGSGQNGNV